MNSMLTIRWWVATTTAASLLFVGILIGFLVEETLESVSQDNPLPPLNITLNEPLNITSLSPPSVEGRSAEMEAGARFMTRVSEHKKRLEENPNDVEALTFLGNANYDITQFEKAVHYYERVLKIEPERARIRTDLATSYYRLGQVDKALEEIRTVLAFNPIHENALLNLGVILIQDKNDTRGAIKAWEKLLAEHPGFAEAEGLRVTIEELKSQH